MCFWGAVWIYLKENKLLFESEVFIRLMKSPDVNRERKKNLSSQLWLPNE